MQRLRHEAGKHAGAVLGAVGRLQQDLPGACPHLRLADFHLQQAVARGWERLLKQVESIVVVQNLDRLGQRHRLLLAHLDAILPLLSFAAAALLQLGQEFLVLRQPLLGVLDVVRHLSVCHRQFPASLRLGLDLLGQGVDLLSLGRHELVVDLDGACFLRPRVAEAALHLVAHLLQYPGDFAAPRGVLRVLGAGQERKHRVPVAIVYVLGVLAQHRSQGCCRVRLQKSFSHALLQGGNGLGDGAYVGRVLRLEGREVCGLLLADGGGLGHRVLGVGAVSLGLLGGVIALHLRLRPCLELGLEHGDLVLRGCDALRQVARARLAVTHELIEELLLSLTFLLYLFLHLLQKVDHLPHRVGSGLHADPAPHRHGK
mmetsp:Transcript_105103/g.274381  ORF Transcript_105103/g.274381 Transcript_105103/m.274381 type:complete len:372 (+) Transcript_105103:1074-2189(+)